MDIPQVIVQMPNLDRATATAGTLISENIQHTQRQEERTRGVRQTENVIQTDDTKAVKPVEDDDKKKRGLLTRKRNQNNSENEEQEEQEKTPGKLINIRV